MATPQTYTPVNDVTIPTTIPQDNGGTLSLANLSQTELNYKASIEVRGGAVGTGNKDMFTELQDFVSIFCRLTPTGLSTASASGSNVYPAITPREVLFRLRHMIDSMLTQSAG